MSRPGIALPMVILVLVALAMLSSLALGDALLAARVASLAEDEVMARATALRGDSVIRQPPNLALLCLLPPSVPQRRVLFRPDGRVEISWWTTRPGLVRVQVTGVGPAGGRYRRLGWLRPDSLLPLDSRPGCPDAGALVPAVEDWRSAHPEG